MRKKSKVKVDESCASMARDVGTHGTPVGPSPHLYCRAALAQAGLEIRALAVFAMSPRRAKLFMFGRLDPPAVFCFLHSHLDFDLCSPSLLNLTRLIRSIGDCQAR
jgi:hypothetical protein